MLFTADLKIDTNVNCHERNTCRVCGGKNLTEFLNLGNTPPADQFRTAAELAQPEILYPLRVNLCLDCGLSQLSHVVDPHVLYQHDYPYEASMTSSGTEHWEKFAEQVVARLSLAVGTTVVDVGSNTGTLLAAFKKRGCRVLGVDPAANIVAMANQNGIETLCGFFEQGGADMIKEKIGAADVITGTNVFAHIDDLAALLREVLVTLTERGVFIFESPHMLHLVENLEYDTIYHEHLSYLSLRPVMKLVQSFGLDVFAVEETEIHGGSFRVYIGKIGQHQITDSVADMLARENTAGIHTLSRLQKFAEQVAVNRQQLIDLIAGLLMNQKKIVAVSAPAKGMTLLNYCGLGQGQLKFITEKSKLKIGRFAPGTNLPVVADEQILVEQPDYALLLAWNFAPEIMRNLKTFVERGGKFIIPIPQPRIV